MFKRFLKEEEGQGAIEYLLLAGGVIVAAVVIFAIYNRMKLQAEAETGSKLKTIGECRKRCYADCGEKFSNG